MNRLKELLQAAVGLELSTIPPYLCALYSMHPEGNDEAKLVIRSVVVEEMLHMVLAANVLNAIGGEPRITADHAPRYPHELPDGVVLDLLPFSPQAVDAFLTVENPGHSQAKHPHDNGARRHPHHISKAAAAGPKTIGEFYAEIADELERTVNDRGEDAVFTGDPARQVTREYYYAGGGGALDVSDLASAKRALAEIVEQGEGEMHSMYDEDGDLAHFFRFQQLKYGRAYLRADDAGIPSGPPVDVDYDAAYPMLPNPRLTDYADPDLRTVASQANRAWSLLLEQIERAFNGEPGELIPAVHTMFKLRDAMLVLLANPLAEHPGRNAGPTFEWEAAPA